MAKARLGVGLFAGCLLVGGLVGDVQAQQPSVAKILEYRPKMEGVDYTIPAESEHSGCEVKLVKGTQQGSSGWMVVDGSKEKKTLRRFFDSNGDKRIDMYSYYKDGLEVYRETDTNFNGKMDNYRWLNSGGMKWGIDTNEDGVIDYWRMISSEEAAHEALQAVAAKDVNRLKALLISDTELQSLGLQPAYVEKIKAKLDKAADKFATVTNKLPNLNGKKLAGHVEGKSPQCVPGESIGASKDLFRYTSRAIGFQTGDNQHEWLNTGEMIQVGLSWRLLDSPTIGDSPTGAGQTEKIPAKLQRLLEQLADLDKNPPPALNPGPNAQAVAYNMKRAALIEQIIPEAPAAEQETWLKQKGDNLEQAALFSEAGNKSALEELRQYKEWAVKKSADGKLAAYLTYRLLRAEYLPKLTDDKITGPAMAKVQGEWMEKLAGFVEAYPKAEDAPDALYQLAMGAEYGLKDDEAKKRYKQLATDFPTHLLAARCEGAVRRLELVGKKMELIGQTLSGGTFSMANHRDKAVVVYYWASYCTDCTGHFEKLRRLHQQYGPKGLEIVSVNLDDDAAKARLFLQGNPLPGEHLFAAGKDTGMNSPLATQYGIMGLPTIFLVGRDGNVITRSIQINDLEDAVKKATEK